MNILLTGGTGFIGSHTAVELLEAGHTVIILDSLSNSSEAVIARIRAITGKEPIFCRADCTDPQALEQLFSRHRPDAVIHLAGLKAVGESVAKPLLYYRCNLDSTLALLECMERHGVNRLIYSSSATVYGSPGCIVYTEDLPTGGCANPYGSSKQMQEQIIQDYAQAHPDFVGVLLRYFNPVGAHPSGLLGEAPNGIPNNLMPYITQVAAGKQQQLRVFGDDYPTPDGTGVRDYIHVVDLARGHLAALDWDKPGTEAFNLGTGVGYSVLDMVRTFGEATGVEIPYVVTPRRPGDLAAYYADPAKAKALLNWEARLTLADMCRDAWNWQSRNPDGYDSPLL